MLISFISALVLWLYAWYLIHRNWYRINRLENRVSELENCACEESTGHWINGKCDQCGEYVPFKSKYCPNCGARMVEPQERSEE